MAAEEDVVGDDDAVAEPQLCAMWAPAMRKQSLPSRVAPLRAAAVDGGVFADSVVVANHDFALVSGLKANSCGSPR